MIMTYKISEGTKATIDGKRFSFDCEPDDIDTAYDALAENIHLNDQDQDNNQNLIDFQNAKDDDVKTLLDDMKQMGFIGSWEVTRPSFDISKLFNKVDFLLDNNDLTFNHDEVSYHGDPLVDINGINLTIYSTYNGCEKIIVDNENNLNYAAMLITQALNNIEASQEMEGEL